MLVLENIAKEKKCQGHKLNTTGLITFFKYGNTANLILTLLCLF